MVATADMNSCLSGLGTRKLRSFAAVRSRPCGSCDIEESIGAVTGWATLGRAGPEGDYHRGMCFGDGIQFTTGCTFGKGNIEKTGEGKSAVTLVDKAANRAVRVAYRPTLQPRIKAAPFMQKRAAGVPPTEIPESEQMEVVALVWDASAAEIMTVGPVQAREWHEPEEVVRFFVCPECDELVAEPYARVVEGRIVCAACSGYPR